VSTIPVVRMARLILTNVGGAHKPLGVEFGGVPLGGPFTRSYAAAGAGCIGVQSMLDCNAEAAKTQPAASVSITGAKRWDRLPARQIELAGLATEAGTDAGTTTSEASHGAGTGGEKRGVDMAGATLRQGCNARPGSGRRRLRES
jgi:hypothetical protein